MAVAKLVALLALLATHAFAHRLAALPRERQRGLGSFAGGVAAAYVFLLVLPKLADQQATLEAATSEWELVEDLYHHAYLLALVGFVLYYLLDLGRRTRSSSIPITPLGLFAVLGFVLYSGMIGDLVGAYRGRILSLVLFASGLLLHLVGLHLALQENVPRSWPWLRVVLGGSLFAGWSVGVLGFMPPVSHALLSAWLAGGIIIHVVLLEIPSQRRPGAFLLGALVFTALMKLTLIATGEEGAV